MEKETYITTGMTEEEMEKLLEVGENFYENIDNGDSGIQDMPEYPIENSETYEDFDDSDTKECIIGRN